MTPELAAFIASTRGMFIIPALVIFSSALILGMVAGYFIKLHLIDKNYELMKSFIFSLIDMENKSAEKSIYMYEYDIPGRARNIVLEVVHRERQAHINNTGGLKND